MPYYIIGIIASGPDYFVGIVWKYEGDTKTELFRSPKSFQTPTKAYINALNYYDDNINKTKPDTYNQITY